MDSTYRTTFREIVVVMPVDQEHDLADLPVTPRRIRLRRTKGRRTPAGTVVVARPSRWGNPFVVEDRSIRSRGVTFWYGFPDHATAVRLAVATFAWHIDHHPNVVGFTRDDIRDRLAGKNLACWCPLFTESGEPAPCHANVLLAIANPGWVPPRQDPPRLTSWREVSVVGDTLAGQRRTGELSSCAE